MAKVSGLKLYLHVFTLHRSMVAFQSHKRSWNVSLPTSTTTCVVSKSPLISSMDVIQPRACKLVVGIVNSRWISPVMTPSKSRFGHVSNSQTTPSRRLRIRNGSIGRLNGMTSTLTTRVRWFPTLSWVVVLPIDQLLSVPCPLTSPRRCGKSLTTIPNASLRYGLRHLPYKGSDGKIDLPHLRNAIARIPQMKGISDSLKASLQARARKLLGGSQKAASEQSGTAVQEAYELLVQNGFDVLDESKEWEHSEPGTGPTPQIGSPEQPDPGTGQPVPRVQGDPAKEIKEIGGGWRRDPLPSPPNPPAKPINQVTTPTEGGENVTLEEELAQLLSVPP